MAAGPGKAATVTYRERSWFDDRLALRDSPRHGRGLFAAAPVARGETLMIWGGTAYTVAQLHAGQVPRGISYSIVDEGVLLTGPADDLDHFVNHSCDPNVWLADGLRVVARRDIAAGEEVVGDYATWESEPEYRLEPCACGAAACRGRVTGDDWRRPELRARYAGHFLPFLERRIAAETAASS